MVKHWNEVSERLWNPWFWRFSKLGWTRPWAIWYNLNIALFLAGCWSLWTHIAPGCCISCSQCLEVLASHMVSHLCSLRSGWMIEVWFSFFIFFRKLFFAFKNILLAFALPCSLCRKAAWLAAGDGEGWRSGTKPPDYCLDWLKVPSGVSLGQRFVEFDALPRQSLSSIT